MGKRTLQNCGFIKKACKMGHGKPTQYQGKCEGYATESSDEPHPICKECKLNTFYEE